MIIYNILKYTKKSLRKTLLRLTFIYHTFYSFFKDARTTHLFLEVPIGTQVISVRRWFFVFLIIEVSVSRVSYEESVVYTILLYHQDFSFENIHISSPLFVKGKSKNIVLYLPSLFLKKELCQRITLLPLNHNWELLGNSEVQRRKSVR